MRVLLGSAELVLRVSILHAKESRKAHALLGLASSPPAHACTAAAAAPSAGRPRYVARCAAGLLHAWKGNASEVMSPSTHFRACIAMPTLRLQEERAVETVGAQWACFRAAVRGVRR